MQHSPHQQLRAPQQQWFGQCSFQFPPPDFLLRSSRPPRVQIQLQALHIPPSPPVQSNHKGGRRGEPDPYATNTNSDHNDRISSNNSPRGFHPHPVLIHFGGVSMLHGPHLQHMRALLEPIKKQAPARSGSTRLTKQNKTK